MNRNDIKGRIAAVKRMSPEAKRRAADQLDAAFRSARAIKSAKAGRKRAGSVLSARANRIRRG